MSSRSRARLLGTSGLVLFGLCLSVLVLELLTRTVLSRRDAGMVFDAELGWHRPHSRHVGYEGRGFATRTYMNSLGLRAPEVSAAPAAGARRILVLGDSMVEGAQVSDSEVVTARIQRALTGAGKTVEVINAGISGYGTLQQALLAKRLAPTLRPHGLVLFVTLSNDLKDNVDRYGGRRPVAILDGAGSYTVEPPRMSWLSVSVRNLLQYSELSYVLRDSLARIPHLRKAVVEAGLAHVDVDTAGKDEEEGLRVLEVVLPRLQHDARAWGIEWTLVVVIPKNRDVEAAEGDVLGTAIHERIAALCGQHDLDCLDLLSVFRRARAGHPGSLFPFSGHWDATGHAVAGRAVAATLLEGRLLASVP